MNIVRNILLAIFVLKSLVAFGQQIRYDKVDFMDNPAWEDVLAEASRTGKLIFFDGYTAWCAPCKKMDKEVFTRPEVANYFNQKFINVKYDMEAPQGVILKGVFDVKAFPTYLFITPDGEVVHRIVGAYTQGNDFYDYSRKAVTSGLRYIDLEQRYKNGERNPAMMFDYMQALRMAGEQQKEAEITRNYLSLMNKDHFMDASYWDAAKRFLNNPTSREFKILLDNREEIGAAVGIQEVDQKIYETISDQIQLNLKFLPYEGHPFDINAENELVRMLEKADIPKRNELYARAKASNHVHNGDWYDLAYMVDALLDFKILSDYANLHKDLDHYAIEVSKVALDNTLLKKALRWSEHTCRHETSPPDRAAFLKTKAMLLEKLGRPQDAEGARKEAESIGKG